MSITKDFRSRCSAASAFFFFFLHNLFSFFAINHTLSVLSSLPVHPMVHNVVLKHFIQIKVSVTGEREITYRSIGVEYDDNMKEY
jgi:hypothetical protein